MERDNWSDAAVFGSLPNLEAIRHRYGIVNAKFLPLVSNLLLNEGVGEGLTDARIQESEQGLRQLGGSGIFFALAQHHENGLMTAMDPLLRQWRKPWRVVAPHETLKGPVTDNLTVDNAGSKMVALISPSRSRIQYPAIGNAVYPWLRSALNEEGISNRETVRATLHDIQFTMAQLLDNLNEFTAYSDKSSLVLSKQEDDGGNVLQIVAIDNGDGIEGNLARRRGIDDAAGFLLQSVDGESGGFALGRGDGLAWIGRTMKKYKGALMVATSPDVHDETLIVDRNYATDDTTLLSQSSMGVKGTVVVAKIPIDNIG